MLILKGHNIWGPLCVQTFLILTDQGYMYLSIKESIRFSVLSLLFSFFQPTISEEASQKLIDHYVSMRQFGARRGQVNRN